MKFCQDASFNIVISGFCSDNGIKEPDTRIHAAGSPAVNDAVAFKGVDQHLGGNGAVSLSPAHKMPNFMAGPPLWQNPKDHPKY